MAGIEHGRFAFDQSALILREHLDHGAGLALVGAATHDDLVAGAHVALELLIWLGVFDFAGHGLVPFSAQTTSGASEMIFM